MKSLMIFFLVAATSGCVSERYILIPADHVLYSGPVSNTPPPYPQVPDGTSRPSTPAGQPAYVAPATTTTIYYYYSYPAYPIYPAYQSSIFIWYRR